MDKIIELAISTGPSILILAAVIFWGKSLIQYFFSESIEIKKDELSQELEKFKLKLKYDEDRNKHLLDLEQSRINQEFINETNISLNKFQIENIKVNRVLPILEELTKEVKNLQALLSTNLNTLFNKGDSRFYEEKRVEIHTKLLDLSGKLDLYIPYEITQILNRLVLLSSNSFHNGTKYDQNYLNIYEITNKKDFFKNASEYLNDHYNVFFELISVYIQEFKVHRKNDTKILDVLKENNFSTTDYKYSTTKFDIKLIENEILLTEFA
ncbi:MAG: hypothetical protein ACQEWG_06265 [Bacteroidota bacterium]